MAREYLLVVGWGGGGGWIREKLRDIPICFRWITFITPRKPIHVTWKHWFFKKCCKQNLKCRKTRMSALNYEFLVQPTRMEGKNSYCVVKCVNEQCIEVLRENRKKLSLLMRNTHISNLCEERSLYFPLFNSLVSHFAWLPSSLVIWLWLYFEIYQ